MHNTQQLLKILENPEVFNVNRLKAHSDHRYYATLEEAKAQGPMPWRYSLNGVWKFNYSHNLDERIVGFEKLEAQNDEFVDIEVPGHIQLQGYDKPHYVNTQYSWDGHEDIRPPSIPKKYNPTAAYIKYFEVPEAWQNQQVYISFQGVETAFNLWCNGKFVGYSEDSFTPSEFDLTPYLNEGGENKLAVEVYKFSSASWLEDQDFWRLSGIFRDVYLYTTPKVHIEDFFVKTKLNATYDKGQVIVDFQVNQRSGCQIEGVLVDGNKQEVVRRSCEVNNQGAQLVLDVEKPNLWSAEKPYLYELQLELRVDGEVTEAICQPVGIREFKLVDRVMKINGKRIVFRGVNRHEFSVDRGRSITREDMEWDVKFLKAHNFNAVRTSHYPNDSYFYELCDKYGLYVIDEANLETHGTWQILGKAQPTYVLPDNKPEFLENIIDRAASMLERDKNHPSIIIWSCGNESYGGENLYKMSQYFRNRDETRLVHYEGIWWDRRFNDTSDMESQMYTRVADIRAYLDDNPQKPFILCEYSHAMANSVGGLNRYIELEDEYELYQGGFIWDYIDQVLWTKDRYGKPYLAYGGDFGDRPSDYNFCTNGIVYGTREPTTKALAIKGAYQPFVIEVEDCGVTIFNKQLFTNLNEYVLKWQLEVDTVIVDSGEMVADLEPLSKQFFELGKVITPGSSEQILTASICEKEATDYSEAGHEIAFGQRVIEAVKTEVSEPIQPFTVVEGDYNVGIHGEGFEVIFSRVFGRLVSLKYGEEEYIYHPNLSLMPSFWRAPVDNDRGHGGPNRMAQWKIASLYASCESMNFEPCTHGLTATFHYQLNTSPAAAVKVEYFVNSVGHIKVKMTYDGVEGLADMFKFGMDLAIPADFENLTWCGYGPDETYADREFGARYGTFSNRVVDNVPGYVMPQACGNHTGVRYAEVTKKEGIGLRISSEKPFSFSALPYTAHELEQAMHNFELPPVHKTVLSINLKEMGVGGDDSWGARPEQLFDLPANKNYEFSFAIEAVKK